MSSATGARERGPDGAAASVVRTTPIEEKSRVGVAPSRASPARCVRFRAPGRVRAPTATPWCRTCRHGSGRRRGPRSGRAPTGLSSGLVAVEFTVGAKAMWSTSRLRPMPIASVATRNRLARLIEVDLRVAGGRADTPRRRHAGGGSDRRWRKPRPPRMRPGRRRGRRVSFFSPAKVSSGNRGRPTWPRHSRSTIGRMVAAPSTRVSSRPRRRPSVGDTWPRSKSAADWISSMARKATSRSRGIASTVATRPRVWRFDFLLAGDQRHRVGPTAPPPGCRPRAQGGAAAGRWPDECASIHSMSEMQVFPVLVGPGRR